MTQGKIKILHDEAIIVLRILRDFKVAAKSTKKEKLTKLIKHQALMVEMYADLIKALEKK